MKVKFTFINTPATKGTLTIMRTPQEGENKGSLKWIQTLINKCPEVINHQLGINNIQWLK